MDQLKSMKELLTAQVNAQLANIKEADAHELGAAVDMIKDISETMYYCSVVEAMEKAEKESKESGNNGNTVYYTERYLPMMYRENPRNMGDNRYNDGSNNYYDNNRYRSENGVGQGGSNGGNSYYDGGRYNMPYYDFQEPVARDLREGRSPRSRRRYMESKEQHQPKEAQIQELEKYMTELSQDMTEMIADSTPEEKQMLHKKLVTLTDKIAVLATK